MAESSGGSRSRRHRPDTTPEGREARIVSMAFDLVEKRIREGTATSQEVTHFLKLGSSRELLEQEKLRTENVLAQARVESMASQARMEDLYAKAISAMRTYGGHAPEAGAEDEVPEEYR